MNPYVPIVDPTADLSPSRDTDMMDEFIEALYVEGWSFEQTSEWATTVWKLSPLFLKADLSGSRRN